MLIAREMPTITSYIMASDEPEYQLVDQNELESSISHKANKAILAKDLELDEKRLQKTLESLAKANHKIKTLEARLNSSRTKLSQRKTLRDEIQWFREHEQAPLAQDMQDIQHRMKHSRQQLNEGGGTQALEGETEKDFLIRTGKITAFGSASGFTSEAGTQSRVNLRAPGFLNTADRETGGKPHVPAEVKNEGQESVHEKVPDEGKLKNDDEHEALENGDVYEEASATEEAYNKEAYDSADSGSVPGNDEAFEPSDFGEDSVSETEMESPLEAEPLSQGKDVASSDRNVDDGDERFYQQRLKEWVEERRKLRGPSEGQELEEWFMPHPKIPDAVLNDKFKLPGDIFPSLFDYQKTCVQWLWELYTQKTGGIIGDEMGLGKTIQVIAFLAGLHYSNLLDKPVLLVVPATVLNQWVNEFHRWWPPLRCVILHSIGSGMTKKGKRKREAYDFLEDEELPQSNASHSQAKEIVERVFEKGHVLVTTYMGLRNYSNLLLPKKWGYVVLDEGHKLRNPNLEISLTCKRVRCHNRIILSGTPIQNNLIELWSLFDFVFPGRLGTLPIFEQQFSIPINMGGYSNASNVQVQTGYKCAVILKDLIAPYLLRRLKVDVAQDLPKKHEMVLFVKLTQYQQDMYERFLGSEDVSSILNGKRNLLMGVDMLRKICNHPDLVDREALQKKSNYDYGSASKSGKLQVLKNLLQLWQLEEHRTLLFCQTKQMLDILEKFVGNLKTLDHRGMEYLRMDGSTPIVQRQQLVDTFNHNTNYDVFLLTTKVGGLGVNLTGADRVIIFDPDWNPSTDIQARERAWRLGQKRDITIYRLMSAGTIEEKIYHRQIFKTFLTNKILKDPKQKRFFKMNDLHDLFTLGDPDEKGTETGDLFLGSEQVFGGEKERRSRKLDKAGDDDFQQVAGIMGVSKMDKFQGGESEEEHEASGDQDIMSKLFSKSRALHSTFQHDDALNSTSEVSLAEKEANRVAKEAAEALKKSRVQARKNVIGTPTWTGRFGSAGRFGPKKAKASSSPLSSASILKELRQTKTTSQPDSDKKQLMEHLVDFLQKQPQCFSKSKLILLSLPRTVDVTSEAQMVMVRSLLRQVAEWDRHEKGWRLKTSFKA